MKRFSKKLLGWFRLPTKQELKHSAFILTLVLAAYAIVKIAVPFLGFHVVVQYKLTAAIIIYFILAKLFKGVIHV